MSFVASPSVRAYAAQHDVGLERLARSIGRETLAREDVDRYLAGGTEPLTDHQAGHSRYWDVDHAQFGPVSTVPMPRMAQVAAANLAAANTMIPQVTHHDHADMRAVEAFRASLKAEGTRRGVKITALAFHVKVLARCLIDFPKFNASVSVDGATIIQKHFVHIGIAIDTPHGLMVPVIRNADQMGLWQIATRITDLATRALARKIRPDEMGGASMTISNLGGIGGSAFTPIVNPPELAILGLTRSEMRPVWDGTTWQPVPMTPLDLSYDHRVINGADAARFLNRFASLMAEPRRLMI
ncbi:MAG: 2-oxo acid dehydrogenase subunit E2 [Pseudorhodobacter sp.]|nr:2-oxo acid dehydrogenase subunit E2 [Pseudorhodobacter sp.]